MAFVDDLVTLLEDAGVGYLASGTLFISTNSKPPIVASGVVSIVETGGSSPIRTQNSVIKPAYTMPSAQITARAQTPDLARAKAQEAYDAVVGIRNSLVTNFISSGWYREINPLQEPFDGGVDDRNQSKFIFNIVAIRRGQ